MNKQIIHTNKAPAAVGPYSQAIKHGNMVFSSGQIPLDPETGEIVGTNVQEQSVKVLDNLVAVLSEAGASLSQVVKTTCFLSDMGDFAQFNEIYSQYFTENPPARSCVAVKTLPKNVLVEIEAIAIL